MINLIFTYLLVSIGSASVVDSLSDAVSDNTINLNTYKDNLSEDQILEVMNSDQETKPSAFIVYKMVDDNKILLRHLFDLNQDEKIDVAKYFENGKVKRTESMLDREGKVFAITDYDLESGDPIKKVTFDQEVLVTQLFYKSELRREEIDRNLDGKIDMWVHYRDGKVLKSEVDENFDGENIKVILGEKPEINL